MIIEKINELDKLISYLKNDEKELIIKALNFSDKAHANQLRKSGDIAVHESPLFSDFQSL